MIEWISLLARLYYFPQILHPHFSFSLEIEIEIEIEMRDRKGEDGR